MRDYDDKLCFIERSVLELGSEVYKLKQELKTVRFSHKNILDQLKALRLLLDDGGVISLDDFDGAIDLAEAIMRVEKGSEVSKMSSKELKRDLLLYAKRNPGLFLELVNDDNVQLRNFGIKATELNIIKLSSDQRHFMWGSNDRKLMTVPFDEHPYSALAQWFKTDEGMEVYTNIEKRLS